MRTQSLPGFTGYLECADGIQPRRVTHVIFDFDGTLSIIRQGWPEIMTPMFAEMLPPLPGESQAERERICLDDIMRLNGKQTIYQMIQLADRIRERGGSPKEPLWYKHEYLRRLDERISERIQGLQSGRFQPDQYLVHGSRNLLDGLKARGLPMYLASGTDDEDVKNEARILGYDYLFEGRIYGAVGDITKEAKKMVLDRILDSIGESAFGTVITFGAVVVCPSK